MGKPFFYLNLFILINGLYAFVKANDAFIKQP
jgi:hypothetical protein